MGEYTIGGCDPLPPETVFTVGYQPDSKVVLLMFTHPGQRKGFYKPITVDDAKKVVAMLQEFCEIADNAHRRLDS